MSRGSRRGWDGARGDAGRARGRGRGRRPRWAAFTGPQSWGECLFDSHRSPGPGSGRARGSARVAARVGAVGSAEETEDRGEPGRGVSLRVSGRLGSGGAPCLQYGLLIWAGGKNEITPFTTDRGAFAVPKRMSWFQVGMSVMMVGDRVFAATTDFFYFILIKKIFFNYFFFFFFVLCPFRASPAAYGGSQARGLIGAVAAGLHHSHSNARSEPHLGPTPQLTATRDPQPIERGQGSNPQPYGSQSDSFPPCHNRNSCYKLLYCFKMTIRRCYLMVEKEASIRVRHV